MMRGFKNWLGIPLTLAQGALFLCAIVQGYVVRAAGRDTLSCGVMPPAEGPSRSDLRPATPWTVGLKKLIFYRVRFSNDKADPVSAQDADETLAEVNAIFTRISGGKFQLAWTISPVLQLGTDREIYGGPGGFDRFIDAVRAAGLAAGFDYRDYDLDIARHSGVPGFMGGNANLGTRGAQVQAPGAVLIVHELGHNLGLNHANAWVAGNTGLGAASPPLPSNFPGEPDPRTIPVYPDSSLGHESIIGPGFSAEYGDLFDIMGSGGVEFSALYRYQLGWWGSESIAEVGSGLVTTTIQDTEGVIGHPPLPRAIRVTAALNTPLGAQEYWVQLPPLDPNVTSLPGVQLRWADRSGNHGGSQLLAPAVSDHPIDNGVTLAPGRTFSDFPSGVHITVLDISGDDATRTAQVVVFSGDSSTNHPPVVAIQTAPAHLDVSQPLTLAATALDADGDSLVWHWDFGDGTSSTSPANVLKSWRRAGDFLVYLVVSDLKGGVGRARLMVRVGDPQTYRVSGRVLTRAGTPVPGARVHNGINDSGTSLNRARFTFTDSQGAYTLPGVLPGTYPVGAFLHGYSVARRESISVTDRDLADIDFMAEELPRVSVTGVTQIGEDAGFTNLFVLTRTGHLDQPLTVLYRLDGSATSGRDYVRPFIDRLTIPGGASNAVLSLNIQDDGVSESDETITLHVSYPVQAQRFDRAGNPYTVYYPGWDLASVDGIVNWVRTEPSYIPGAGASATVLLRDNDSVSPVIVSLAADSVIGIENPRVDTSFHLTRTGDTSRAVEVHFEITGTAQNGVDYTLLPDVITFLPGETERIIAIEPIADNLAEPEEQVVLHILPRSEYGIEVASATASLRDHSEVPPDLAVALRLDGDLQLTLRAQPASRLVLERSHDFAHWIPIRTNFLFNSDTAIVTLPNSRTNAFFRTVVAPP